MSYTFRRASTFIDQDSQYFVSRQLHIHNTVQTIGKVCYTSENIVLESLRTKKTIPLNVLSDEIPEDGMFIIMFGMFSFFSDKQKIGRYNFENPQEGDEFIVILDLEFWNEVPGQRQAEIAEDAYYKTFRHTE